MLARLQPANSHIAWPGRPNLRSRSNRDPRGCQGGSSIRILSQVGGSLHRFNARRYVAGLLVIAALWIVFGEGDGGRSVVVAARELEAGHRLTPDDLSIVSLKGAPADSIFDPAISAGRTLRIGLLEGEPIVERKLAPPGADSISALIPPGMVAAEFVPASRVDARVGDSVLISATLDAGRIETKGNPYRVVAERARVIRAESGSTDSGSTRRLTVLLTPQERSYLATGAGYGTLDAALVDPSG